MQKTLEGLLRVDPKTSPLQAKGDHNKPFKDLVSNSRWTGNATSRRSVVKKCRARVRSIAPGTAAAPVLIVTAEAPVLRVLNNRPGKRRRAPSQPGKARHPADNVQRVEAVVLAVRAEVVAAQAEAVVAEEVVVVAGERVQEHEITGFVLGKERISLPFLLLPVHR